MKKYAICLNEISKDYYIKKRKIKVFNNLNIKFEYNKLYGLVGNSGCGKSTLIKILGLLEKPSDGYILIDDQVTKNRTDEEESVIRNKKIGFVFQDYLLDNNLNVIDNVLLPIYANQKYDYKAKMNKAIELLSELGLENRLSHFPSQLSGGEQQRVAIARALINDPCIILADEPTGNLDKQNEIKILTILKNLSTNGKCVIVVSHSGIIKDFADEIINLEVND